MNSALTPAGFFFIYFAFNVFSTIFVIFFIAETKGCTEREKKYLYIPGSKYGRKLREGEDPP